MNKFFNNFDDNTLKLMLCTAYSTVEEKQKLNEVLNEDILTYRRILDNHQNHDIKYMNNIRNNLRKMELLVSQQNNYITNGKLLIKHLIYKINNPRSSELAIFRYIGKLDECQAYDEGQAYYES
jgi:hypothetical protein